MKRTSRTILLLCLLLMSVSCSVVNKLTATDTPAATETPLASPTPVATMTPTPPPSAAVVNGIYVWEEDYNSTIENLRQAYISLGEIVPADDALSQEALDQLINETLFLSAAEKTGLRPTADEISAKRNDLVNTVGGEEALSAWMNTNHYSADGLLRALEREIAIARMRDVIFAERLSNIEQVHAWRIRTDYRSSAEEALQTLSIGFSFPEVAAQYDDLTGGDMNWFPRGVMFDSDLENTVFALEPGSYSGIIEHDGSFYIFYVAEKRTDRQLDQQVLEIVQPQVLSAWLEEQQSAADITRYK